MLIGGGPSAAAVAAAAVNNDYSGEAAVVSPGCGEDHTDDISILIASRTRYPRRAISNLREFIRRAPSCISRELFSPPSAIHPACSV